MTTTRPWTIRLDEPGVLIAAVPALLGFNPANSILVITHRGPQRRELGLVLRADLPSPDGVSGLAEQFARPARLYRSTGATLLVVDGRDGSEQYRTVVEGIRARMQEVDIPTLHMLWVPRIGAGAPWRCLEDPGCSGEVDDPKNSPLSALGAGGHEANITRADLEARIAPDPPEALERRAALLDEVCFEGEATTGAVLFERICAAAERCVHGDSLDDREMAGLCAAVTRTTVRDAVLLGRTEQEHRSLRALWALLTRSLPKPACARAACLLAVGAYVDGDGAMTGIALDRALDAEPDNRLANLLAESLRCGMPPDRLRPGFENLAQEARRRLGVS